jgi:hypothetical protein
MYSPNVGFHGQDALSLTVVGAVRGTRGGSTIEVSVSVAPDNVGPDGSHTIVAPNGARATFSLSVASNLSADTTPPSVSFIAPPKGGRLGRRGVHGVRDLQADLLRLQTTAKARSTQPASAATSATRICSTPLVSAGSELRGASPHELVVTIGALTPISRKCCIICMSKPCSKSFRNNFDGPCSQERHVLSFGSPNLAANAVACAM